MKGVPQKQKLQLDAIRKLADHARNYHEYRSRLRNTAPPAVPFLGRYYSLMTIFHAMIEPYTYIQVFI